VETKAHLCFLKKVRGRCGSVYGTKGAVDRKSLGTAGIEYKDRARYVSGPGEKNVNTFK
jgi:hypothetical protein